MARPTNRLSTRSVAAAKAKGRYADGGGLYLHVESEHLKRWVFVYQWEKRRREIGLGKVGVVTLAEAREAALDARRLVYAGKNPMLERRARKSPKAAVATFGSVAEAILTTLESDLDSKKHLAQWRTSLKETAKALTPLPINEVTTDHVLGVLKPIWLKTPETASRVRGRIERVLDAAKAQGLRTGDNPARWRGHLKTLLPKRVKLTRGHHAAMPFADVADFMVLLANRPAIAARALEFTILTSARTGEALGARWEEMDFDLKVWKVPKERMKARKEHRVPLSPAAIDVLRKSAPHPPKSPQHLDKSPETPFLAKGLSGLIFPGGSLDKPLSNMAMEMLLRRMNVGAWTVHGFRSTFRDWAGDTTDHRREIIEAALAHSVGSTVERAYRRGDALEKRRKLMDDWEAFCLGRPAPFPKSDVPS
jgi:integrase